MLSLILLIILLIRISGRNDMIPIKILILYFIFKELFRDVDLELLTKVTSSDCSSVEIFIGLQDICEVLNQEEAVVDF